MFGKSALGISPLGFTGGVSYSRGVAVSTSAAAAVIKGPSKVTLVPITETIVIIKSVFRLVASLLPGQITVLRSVTRLTAVVTIEIASAFKTSVKSFAITNANAVVVAHGSAFFHSVIVTSGEAVSALKGWFSFIASSEVVSVGNPLRKGVVSSSASLVSLLRNPLRLIITVSTSLATVFPARVALFLGLQAEQVTLFRGWISQVRSGERVQITNTIGKLVLAPIANAVTVIASYAQPVITTITEAISTTIIYTYGRFLVVVQQHAIVIFTVKTLHILFSVLSGFIALTLKAPGRIITAVPSPQIVRLTRALPVTQAALSGVLITVLRLPGRLVAVLQSASVLTTVTDGKVVGVSSGEVVTAPRGIVKLISTMGSVVAVSLKTSLKVVVVFSTSAVSGVVKTVRKIAAAQSGENVTMTRLVSRIVIASTLAQAVRVTRAASRLIAVIMAQAALSVRGFPHSISAVQTQFVVTISHAVSALLANPFRTLSELAPRVRALFWTRPRGRGNDDED